MNGIISVILMILFVLLGVVYCFWGYKYLRLILFFYAFCGGGMFMYNLLEGITPELGVGNVIIAVTIGLILGALAYFFVKFAIFLAGGVIGIMIFSVIREINPAAFASMAALYVFLIGLACFIVMGVVTLMAKKHLIVIFTAVFGAYSLVTYAGTLIGSLLQPNLIDMVGTNDVVSSLSPYSVFATAPGWMYFLPIIIFAILGIIAQYKYTAKA